jgi:nucleotide-binding universal stress UspA family protein
MSLTRILAATDFSSPSDRAARFARAIADETGAELRLVHVMPIGGLESVAVEPFYVPPALMEKLTGDRAAENEEQLAQLEKDLGGERLRTVLLRGEPVQRVVEYAEAEAFDLLVLGSHGRGPSRLLLGSVSEKVSRAAPCPVLVTRGEDRTSPPQGRFSRIVVGVDYTSFSAPAAALAARVLAPGGIIELFHSWDQPYLSAYDIEMKDKSELFALAEKLRAREAERLDRFAAALDLGPIEVKKVLGSGSPHVAILDRAEESDADLIVVGAHGRERLDERILGTVADRVLRHANVPVLLLPTVALARTTGDA